MLPSSRLLVWLELGGSALGNGPRLATLLLTGRRHKHVGRSPPSLPHPTTSPPTPLAQYGQEDVGLSGGLWGGCGATYLLVFILATKLEPNGYPFGILMQMNMELHARRCVHVGKPVFTNMRAAAC